VRLVVADAGAGLERTLAEHELHAGRLVEKRVPDRLTAAVVSARLVLRNLCVVLDDVASSRFLLSYHHTCCAQHNTCEDVRERLHRNPPDRFRSNVSADEL